VWTRKCIKLSRLRGEEDNMREDILRYLSRKTGYHDCPYEVAFIFHSQWDDPVYSMLPENDCPNFLCYIAYSRAAFASR
jgi:hypothetical protein